MFPDHVAIAERWVCLFVQRFWKKTDELRATTRAIEAEAMLAVSQDAKPSLWVIMSLIIESYRDGRFNGMRLQLGRIDRFRLQ